MHILIVDDEPLVRAMAKRALRDYECDMASDSEEALELYEEHHYDLVVTDLLMPGKNGHQLTCELLDLEDAPQIIVITACADARLRQDLLSRGVKQVFTKPMDLAALETEVESLAQQSQVRVSQS